MEIFSVYTVVKGDTLFSIAKRLSMSVSDLKTLNKLTSDTLRVGQTLHVRMKNEEPTPTPPPPPTPTPPPAPPAGNYLAARKTFVIETRPDNGFRRYLMTVPLANGTSILASMRDNISYSKYMVYPNGLMYGGQSHLAVDVADIQGVGLTLAQARALQYVSTHEGQFDAINSYDRAIFSYGFIQFTGASAVGGSLNKLMTSMDTNAPSAFQRIFQRVGIDTDGGIVTVLNDNGARLKGDDAWLYIQENIQLYGAFIQAGFEPSLVREQLRMANSLYVQPALNFSLKLTFGGLTIAIPRLGEVLTSEGSLTLVIALAINQGVGGMSKIMADAIARVAARTGASSLWALKQLNEQEICTTVAANTTDDRVRARAQGVLDAGLSWES